MNSENISVTISELAQSLELSADGYVNWNQFLVIVINNSGAAGGVLSCSIRYDESYEKPTPVVKGVYKSSFCLGYMDSSIELSFSSEMQQSQGGVYWQHLKKAIQEIYKLGMQWQEKHQLQKITENFAELKKMASVDVDASGRILRQSGIFDSLLESGAMRLEKGRLEFSEEPSWFLKTQKEMMLNEDSKRPVYKYIRCGSKSYRCVINYQQNVNNGWAITKHQFSIAFYQGVEQSTSLVLNNMTSLSKPEVEIASWFSLGLSAEDVAKSTGYALSTVYSYIKSLYGNLEINKQSQLTAAVWQELPL